MMKPRTTAECWRGWWTLNAIVVVFGSGRFSKFNGFPNRGEVIFFFLVVLLQIWIAAHAIIKAIEEHGKKQ